MGAGALRGGDPGRAAAGGLASRARAYWRHTSGSGRETDLFQVGFSPRRETLTLYINGGLQKHDEIMQRLGKYDTGTSCIHVKSLSEVDRGALQELIDRGVDELQIAPRLIRVTPQPRPRGARGPA